MRKIRANTGFTLIELLVVIAIIGLLASVILINLNNARAKARNTKRFADVNQIAESLEFFFNDCGAFPALPPSTTGIKIDSTKALYTGTATQCNANDQTTGANGVLPNGGFGANHTAGAGETFYAVAFATAPTPIDDGNLTTGNKCSENNSQTGFKWGEYSYASFAPGNSAQYWIYFCISDTVGNLSAGRYIMTERGIVKYSGNMFP